MEIRVGSDALPRATGTPFAFRSHLDDVMGWLTDNHAASSYGQPVLLYKGIAYGPGDLPCVTLKADRDAITRDGLAMARAAGWQVDVVAYCRWCGEPLQHAERDWDVIRHAQCSK